MSSEEARAFVARWKLVAEVERDALRSTPLEKKFADLAALVSSARALGWETTDQAEVEEVRARWNRLVEKHRG